MSDSDSDSDSVILDDYEISGERLVEMLRRAADGVPMQVLLGELWGDGG